MKISYTFANGENSEVEVNEEIGTFILDSRREEDNLGRKERYHCYSLNAAEFEGENQSEYAKRYDTLVERFETAKARQEEVQASITEKQAQRKMMENFMEVLRGLPEQVDYFDEAAWYAMVDFVTVYGKEDVRFTFKNGMEVPVKAE